MWLLPQQSLSILLTPIHNGEDFKLRILAPAKLCACSQLKHIVHAPLKIADVQLPCVGPQVILFYGGFWTLVLLPVRYSVASYDAVWLLGGTPHNSNCCRGHIREVDTGRWPRDCNTRNSGVNNVLYLLNNWKGHWNYERKRSLWRDILMH